jgi:hypothetical protein
MFLISLNVYKHEEKKGEKMLKREVIFLRRGWKKILVLMFVRLCVSSLQWRDRRKGTVSVVKNVRSRDRRQVRLSAVKKVRSRDRRQGRVSAVKKVRSREVEVYISSMEKKLDFGLTFKLWRIFIFGRLHYGKIVLRYVCPYIRVEQLGSHRTYSDEMLYSIFFLKSFENI